MKLLFYSHVFAPSVGGVETITLLLARGLAASRPPVQLTVATATPRDGFDDAAEPYAIIRRPSAWSLWRLIRAADVVHLAGPALAPLALALLARRPVVVEHHGFQAACPNGQLLFEPDGSPCPGHFMAGHYRECWRCNAASGRFASLRLWALTFPRRWLCRRTAANVMPTAWLGTVLQLPRAEMIAHGLPLGPAPAASPDPSAPPEFVFQGRLVSTKGVATLIEAARLLRDRGRTFRVTIVGAGPLRESLEARARALGLGDCVCFAGQLHGAALEAALARAAAVVMPSLGGEVFGLVAAENMQRSRLVITSDLGALREVVGDAGLSFPVGDAAGLAAAMESVLADPARAAALARAGRERIEARFRVQTMVELHASLYRSLARHEPARRT